MVTNVTSLTGNGLKDWLIQRITALYFALFTLYLAGYFVLHPHMTFDDWNGLFQCKGFQIATFIALLAFVLHAWIGIWTVTTDYIKCTALRLSVQLLVLLALLIQLIAGVMMIWGQ